MLMAESERQGLYIGNVEDSSPAKAGGLKSGDRIIEVTHEIYRLSVGQLLQLKRPKKPSKHFVYKQVCQFLLLARYVPNVAKRST